MDKAKSEPLLCFRQSFSSDTWSGSFSSGMPGDMRLSDICFLIFIWQGIFIFPTEAVG